MTFRMCLLIKRGQYVSRVHLCDMQYPVAASIFGLIWIAGRILYFQVINIMQGSRLLGTLAPQLWHGCSVVCLKYQHAFIAFVILLCRATLLETPRLA